MMCTQHEGFLWVLVKVAYYKSAHCYADVCGERAFQRTSTREKP